jgi:hypothetical protein
MANADSHRRETELLKMSDDAFVSKKQRRVSSSQLFNNSMFSGNPRVYVQETSASWSNYLGRPNAARASPYSNASNAEVADIAGFLSPVIQQLPVPLAQPTTTETLAETPEAASEEEKL